MEFSRAQKIYVRPIQIDRWIEHELAEWHQPETVRMNVDLQSNATVLIDGEKFRQALVNLLQNAQQAILQEGEEDPPAGAVSITTRKNGAQFELRISDDGCGLQPGTKEKIFSPLFSTKAFGVGLGLPLVKRIVEDHRGGIGVESEWGVGTTISVRLPLAEDQPLRDAG